MSEHDPALRDDAQNSSELEDDADEDLADAYEALAEDRRRQQEERAATDLTPNDRPEAGAGESTQFARDAARAPQLATAASATVAPAEAAQPPATADALEPTPSANPVAQPPTSPSRRVFVIDQREYPDPDPDLPITGARSVQAMYRDYFPGQLDNADVVQKTREDGTLEVTFKRRVGTKGARRTRAGAGEVAITVPRVVGVLAALPASRPLVWDLVEQAVALNGALRLEYAPQAAQLNLAEAQQAAQARQIEQTVGELRRLRPTG